MFFPTVTVKQRQKLLPKKIIRFKITPGMLKDFKAAIILSGVYKGSFLWPIFSAIVSKLSQTTDLYFYQGTVFKNLPGKLAIKPLQKCKNVLCTNKSLSSQLSGLLGNECIYLPPGISLDSIDRTEPVKKNAKIRIGYINHFNKVKGVDIALDAFAKLDLDDTEYILAGGGVLENEMREKYGSHKNIRFLGYCPNIIALIKSCDFLVLPFRTGASVLGISQTVLEAMACGVPVIGSNVDVITSAISHGKEGLIFNSPAELVDYIKRLHDNADLREQMSEAAKKVAADYDINLIADKLYNIIEKD
jgi:glycosyltransferase involved in cell wall biosynthesis